MTRRVSGQRRGGSAAGSKLAAASWRNPVRRAFVGLAAVFALAIHAEAHAENLEKTEDISQLLEMTSFEETSYEAAMRNLELWIPAIRDKLLWSGVEEAHVQRVIALVSEEASIAFRDFVNTEMLL